jgi:hypothetical protein
MSFGVHSLKLTRSELSSLEQDFPAIPVSFAREIDDSSFYFETECESAHVPQPAPLKPVNSGSRDFKEGVESIE